MALVLGGMVVMPKQLEAAEQLNNTAWFLNLSQVPYGPYERPEKPIIYNRQYANSNILYQTQYVPGLSKSAYYNCVDFVRFKGNVARGFGQAKRHPINTSVPSVGATVVTYEGAIGHVAFVKEVHTDYIVIEETNYIRGWYTQRKLPIGSKVIKGYYVI